MWKCPHMNLTILRWLWERNYKMALYPEWVALKTGQSGSKVLEYSPHNQENYHKYTEAAHA